MRTCPCGEQFEPAADNQRYHSKACSRKEEKRRAKERNRASTTLTRAGNYSETDVERALTTMIHYGGSPKKAATALEEMGHPIPYSTLASWKRTHADRYHVLAEREEPRLKAARAEAHESLADSYSEASRLAIDKIHAAIASGEIPPGKIQVHPINTAAGIHRDKAAQLRGENVTVIEHRSAKDLEDQLKRMGVLVEGEAVEIEPQ